MTFNLFFHVKIIQDEVEVEMRRLKLELKQTMELYSTACKEALTAKQKVLRREVFHVKIGFLLKPN